MALDGCGPVPIMVTGWLLLILALALILARVYLRIAIQRRRMVLGDYMMVLGWLAALAVVGLAVVLMKDDALQPHLGNTLAGFKSSPDEIQEVYKIFWIFNLPLFSAFYLCKGALLSMYLEIFPRFMVKRRIFLWATVAFIGTCYAVSVLALFLLCTPIETYWDLRPESTCPPIKTKIIFIIAWALHFAGDVLVFILPWTIIPAVNVRRTLKLGIYCTLLLGLITMTFSLLRFILVIRSQVGDVGPISLAVLWSILECNLGLTITCLPSLRPYFTRGENSPGNSGGGQQQRAKVTDTVRTIGRIRSRKRTQSVTRRDSPAGTEEELTWSEGKQSHRSQSSDADIELAQSKPVAVEDIA